ncbi:putative AraC family transcriptional regulator [Gordonia soli NBRC 108243]|uniref:Putative AraC family transcriptional regulator n=1 Tax=Gordonia soli NBRC 108243 TaxID=1223545 RepID=M0QD84_9ACTN|nr:putative AraC family transcriptional regulator [Gordonia soli NBRC 108243]
MVAVLILAPVVGFDATIPPTLFSEAVDADGTQLYDVVMCGLSTDPVPTTSGYSITPAAGPEVLAMADTVIVPGTKSPEARFEGRLPEGVRAALDSVRPDTRMVSICTGAFILAAAGLFDGLRAATHWKYADDLRRLFPAVDVDETVLFVDEGDRLSSAGLAAGIDLCLHLIRRDHGTAVANCSARHCVVPPWREGGQAQFIASVVPDAGDSGTASTRAWALTNLAEPLTVSDLARHAQMSSRTFSRRFTAETGQSPGGWLRDRRVDLARELLEKGEHSVDAVAELSGLGSPDNLRHHLRRGLGMSPSAYRKRFAGA